MSEANENAFHWTPLPWRMFRDKEVAATKPVGLQPSELPALYRTGHNEGRLFAESLQLKLIKIGVRAATLQRAEVTVTRFTASATAKHLTVIGSQTIGKRQEICLRR